MGGTPHGLVNRYWAEYSSPNGNQNFFASVAAFFDHLSTAGGGDIMERVASNYGNGSGFDRVGGSNPCGTDHSWGVWKMPVSTARPGGGSALGEVYVLLAMFYSTTPGSQNMQLLGSTTADGVGISIAFREDGGNPWNVGGGATQNDDGNDTAGSPLWTAGGSTVHVFPLANNPGGDDNTTKNNLMLLGDAAAVTISNGRFHGIADDDTVALFFTQRRQAGVPEELAPLVFGPGTVRSNGTADPYCYWAFNERMPPFVRGSTYGTAAGTDNDREGGVKVPGGTVHGMRMSYWGLSAQTSVEPDPFTSSGKYLEFGTSLYSTAIAGSTPLYSGWVGFGHVPGEDDFLRFVFNDVGSEGYDATNKRAAFGDGADSTLEVLTVPWPDSIGEAPGATRTLDGVTF